MRTCKYCGTTFHYKGAVCGNCAGKWALRKRFAAARDTLRRKCGLPALEQSTNDENACSIVE